MLMQKTFACAAEHIRQCNRFHQTGYLMEGGMLGFKAFHSTAAMLGNIEAAHMFCKGQLSQTGVSLLKKIAAFAA